MYETGASFDKLFEIQGHIYLLHLLKYGLEDTKSLFVNLRKVKLVIHQSPTLFLIEKLKYLSQSVYF